MITGFYTDILKKRYVKKKRNKVKRSVSKYTKTVEARRRGLMYSVKARR